jgi:hypothetical protein
MKRRSIIRLAILFLIIITLQSCPMAMDYGAAWILRLDNHSNKDLGVYLALGICSAYPDTVFPADCLDNTIAGASAFSTDVIYQSGSVKRESIFKGLPNDTLSVFIFNMDDLTQNSSCDDLTYGKRLLQRYDMSLEDMKGLGSKVPYPPTEAMKNMKMYPPYGSR